MDRYDFRVTGNTVEYLDPVSDDWRRLLRARSREDALETLLTHWKDVRFTVTRTEDNVTTCDYSHGSFKAFS